MGKAVVEVLESTRPPPLNSVPRKSRCGQMHWNTGYLKEAVPIIRHFVDVYRDAEVIVAPSSSCISMMRDHYLKAAEMAQGTKPAADVESLLPRIYEFTEFLVKKLEVDRRRSATFAHKVTLHTSCHSQRSLHLGDIPIARLLKQVRSLELLPIANPQECCGFGGTFLPSRMPMCLRPCLKPTRCATCSTRPPKFAQRSTTPASAADIYGSLHRQRTLVRTVHIAEILASTAGAEFGVAEIAGGGN